VRVAVTGARGRLGGALMHALAEAAFTGPAIEPLKVVVGVGATKISANSTVQSKG